MKKTPTFLALLALSCSLLLLQTGCTVNTVSSPGWNAPPPCVRTWNNCGFYRGATVRGPGWNNRRHVSVGTTNWNNTRHRQVSGTRRNASWNTAGGTVTGPRGGSASWGRSSGSVSRTTVRVR